MDALSIFWDQESIDYEQVLDEMEANGSDGMPLLALSRTTRISMPSLQRFFRRHKKVFIYSPGKAGYKLNPGSPIRGDYSNARIHLVKEVQQAKQIRITAYTAIGVAILFGLLYPIFLAS